MVPLPADGEPSPGQTLLAELQHSCSYSRRCKAPVSARGLGLGQKWKEINFKFKTILGNKGRMVAQSVKYMPINLKSNKLSLKGIPLFSSFNRNPGIKEKKEL